MGDVFVYRVLATPFKTNELFIAVHDLYKAVHVVLVLLAMIGAGAAWSGTATRYLPREKLHVLRMASLILAFLYLIHLPFVVNTRYAIPVYPAMYLLAVFTAVVAARAIWSYGRSSSAARRVEPIPITATPAKPAHQQSPKRPTPGHRKGGGKRRA
jgi:glucan phosphoethanolaminetransferase (alkaline phosphatase superfamily)